MFCSSRSVPLLEITPTPEWSACSTYAAVFSAEINIDIAILSIRLSVVTVSDENGST